MVRVAAVRMAAAVVVRVAVMMRDVDRQGWRR